MSDFLKFRMSRLERLWKYEVIHGFCDIIFKEQIVTSLSALVAEF